MTSFDTLPRSMAGEDALAVIRQFVSSGIIPDSPLRSMAESYLESGAAFGELESRLVFAALCDTLQQMDARLSALERRED